MIFGLIYQLTQKKKKIKKITNFSICDKISTVRLT